MSGWMWVVALNGITAMAYLGIAFFIVRGLVHTGQLRGNRLAVATAAIFVTCAAHHGLHALTLATGGDSAHLAMMREMMGDSVDVVVTASTAVCGTLYLGLRRSYASLLRSPAMFDHAHETRYRQLVDHLPNTIVFVLDRDLRILLAGGPGLAGTTLGQSPLEGRQIVDVLDRQLFERVAPHYQAALGGAASEFDLVSERSGKAYRIRAQPLLDEAGTVVGVVVLSEDVTGQRAAQARLAEAHAFSDAVLAASPDVTATVDLATGELAWSSRSLWDLLGSDFGQQPGGQLARMEDLLEQEDVERLRKENAEIGRLEDGESITGRYRLLGADGSHRWVLRRSTPFARDDTGAVHQGLSVIRDVTDVVDAEEALRHAALHDPLTGLPNRTLLLDRISSAIARSERLDTLTVVLFCDLDGFKRINDTDGHAAGDAVLVEVAHRLSGVLRTSDSIARVGGDEFVIVLDPTPRDADPWLGPDLQTHAVQVAERVGRRIAETLQTPINHEGHSYVVTASVGMTVAHRGSVAENVLRDADTAMYRAKQGGKNRSEVFEEGLRAMTVERSRIEQTLRAALEHTEPGQPALSVAYQPVHELATGRLVSFEALARLTDEQGKPLGPDTFIPVAEDTGLICSLGARVLDDALASLVRWRATHPAQDAVTMSVNLSARQVQHSNMPELVHTTLERHGLAPADLVLEITESVLLQSGGSTLRQIAQLHDAGVGIAIDDFGTGYASLRYLATLPVTCVKVDRSFTAAMTSDPKSEMIVRAIAGLSDDLGIACIVEGIETVEQLHALPAGLRGQGYLLGRPQPEPVEAWRPAAVPAQGRHAGELGTPAPGLTR